MDKLLNMGLKWKQKKSLISRAIGKLILLISTTYAKNVERSARKQELPSSWEKEDAAQLGDKIWEAYQKKEK